MNEEKPMNIVTGAFGFSGKYITQLLLANGESVKTLTGHPERPNPFGDKIAVARLDFTNPRKLTDDMRGAHTLFNSYWIRFAHGELTHKKATGNSIILIKAAVDAGIRRIIHVSITNPSEDAPTPYFRGKAIVEKAIADSGLSYAILRPAVFFGDDGILINNIAWMLRRFPVLPIMGDGKYRIQPIYIDDFASLAVEQAKRDENITLDAIGPEIFAYEEMIATIASKLGIRARFIHLPSMLAYYGSKLLGFFVRDVVLTRDEVSGLMDNLLVTDSPPTAGTTRLSEWVSENSSWLGRKYFSELGKHYG